LKKKYTLSPKFKEKTTFLLTSCSYWMSS